MKERPILFSAPMVRAILAGHKSQTRRVVKLPDDILPERTFVDPGNVPIFGPGPYVKAFHMVEGEELMYPRIRCPYGYPGDRLWVKTGYYKDDYRTPSGRRYIAGMFMRRDLSPATLEIAEVRVERLQDISEDDATAEGVKWNPCDCRTSRGGEGCEGCDDRSAQDVYKALWESINGPGSWAKNPFVWIVEFRRTKP